MTDSATEDAHVLTDLQHAIVENKGAQAVELIEGGADITQTDDKKNTLMMLAALSDCAPVVLPLLRRGLDVDTARNEVGLTAQDIAETRHSSAFLQAFATAAATLQGEQDANDFVAALLHEAESHAAAQSAQSILRRAAPKLRLGGLA